MSALSTDRNKSDAAIYREAAAHIERHDGLSCCVVAYLSGRRNRPAAQVRAAQRYVHVFADSMTGDDSYHRMVAYLPDETVQNFRVLALCFAAAMVETGDA